MKEHNLKEINGCVRVLESEIDSFVNPIDSTYAMIKLPYEGASRLSVEIITFDISIWLHHEQDFKSTFGLVLEEVKICELNGGFPKYFIKYSATPAINPKTKKGTLTDLKKSLRSIFDDLKRNGGFAD